MATRTLPAPWAMPNVPEPTRGAVQAAATGMSPENSVARSAPIRCMPMYQHTKPTTVTTTACHTRAANSAPSGIRSQEPPLTTIPATAASSAAIPHTVQDSSRGPSGRSTGTASTAKPTSPRRAHAEKAIPATSVCPHPWTVKAPAATSNAPYSTARPGRAPLNRGTSTATTTGAHPTKTPGTAGSAVRSAARTARLKPTMPTAASRASRAHWRGASRLSGRRPPRPSSGRSSRHATA